MPSSFSSNLANRNSPTSCRSSRGGVPWGCEVPSAIGGRSVKSIVGWIETSKHSAPISSKSVWSQGGQESSMTKAITLREPPSPQHALPHAPGVEDDSLAFLNYTKFFTESPIGRCLDGVMEDLSTIPLEDLFNNVGTSLASEQTRVNLLSSTHDVERASFPAIQSTAAKATESGAALKRVVDTLDDSNALVVSQKTTDESQGCQEVTTAFCERAATSPEDRVPQLVQRGAQDVDHFWDTVRKSMHISDDEFDYESEARHGDERPVALHVATISRFVWSPPHVSYISPEAQLTSLGFQLSPTKRPQHRASSSATHAQRTTGYVSCPVKTIAPSGRVRH